MALFDIAGDRITEDAIAAGYAIGEGAGEERAVDAIDDLFGAGEAALSVFTGTVSPIFLCVCLGSEQKERCDRQ